MTDHTQDELDNELKELKKANLTTTDIKVRLAVLYDAYRTTFRKDVAITRGEYLQVYGDEAPTRCHACFLGALFLSKVIGVDGKLNFQLNDTGLRSIGSTLEQVLDVKTLAVGEALFEGARIVVGPFAEYWFRRRNEQEDRLDELLRGVRLGQDADGRPHREIGARTHVRYILEHLIENGSQFNLATFDPNQTNFDPEALGFKALQVLKRYGILEPNDFTEEKSGG